MTEASEEFEDWADSVDKRLASLSTRTLIVGGLSGAGLIISGLAFTGLNKLAKTMQELASVTNGIAGLVYGPVAAAANAKVEVKHEGDDNKEPVIDETKVPVDMDVAKPYDPGPKPPAAPLPDDPKLQLDATRDPLK